MATKALIDIADGWTDVTTAGELTAGTTYFFNAIGYGITIREDLPGSPSAADLPGQDIYPVDRAVRFTQRSGETTIARRIVKGKISQLLITEE